MTSKIALAAVLSVLFTAGAVAADSKPSTNKAIAIQALTDLFDYQDLSAVDRYFGPHFIQHDTSVADGLDGLKAFVASAVQRPGFNLTIYRAVADGNMVVVHSVYEGLSGAAGKPMAAFDLFRFRNGRIVEHWEVRMPMGAPNVSGHSIIDGPAAIADLGRTEANRALVHKLVDTLLAGRQFDRAGEFLDANHYTQHNQSLGDGLQAFKAAVAAARKSGVDITYKPHRILAEGNFVFVQSEGGSGAWQVCDLFRLHAGKVVEHWDVLAPIAPRDQWKNNNGPF